MNGKMQMIFGEKCYGMYFNALYNFILKDNTEKGIIIQNFECSTVSREMVDLYDNSGLIIIDK